LDSDDEWLPQKLEKQLKVFKDFKDKKLGFVYCGAIFVDDENRKTIKFLPKRRGYILDSMLEDNCIVGGGSSNLIKREVFDQCGFFDECKELKRGGSQEYEMWIRIAQQYNFDFVNDYLIKYYVHSSNSISTTSELQDKARAQEYVINKFLDEYKKTIRV